WSACVDERLHHAGDGAAVRRRPRLRGLALLPARGRQLGDLGGRAGPRDANEYVAQVLDRVDFLLDARLEDAHQDDSWAPGVLDADVHPVLPADGQAPEPALSPVVGDV